MAIELIATGSGSGELLLSGGQIAIELITTAGGGPMLLLFGRELLL